MNYLIMSIVDSGTCIESKHNYYQTCHLPTALPAMAVCRGLMRVVGLSKMAADSITA